VFEKQISSTIWNKNCVRGTNLISTQNKNTRRHKEQRNCVRGTNVVYPGNKNIVSEEQISSTIWNKNCIRGTNLVNTGNKNKRSRQHKEQKNCVRETNLVYPTNKNTVSEEQILSTIWNKNWVRGTNLVNTGNKNKGLVDTRNTKIVVEKQILSTLRIIILCLRNRSCLLYGTRIASEEQISSTQGTRKNKFSLIKEHDFF
jgi:hypothetical protein